jgi:hypothetical protein
MTFSSVVNGYRGSGGGGVTAFIFYPEVFLYSYNKTNQMHLLTPCCGVLLEELTGLQLVKKFPAFHGT